jgi:hypothetical protein
MKYVNKRIYDQSITLKYHNRGLTPYNEKHAEAVNQ